MVDWRVVAGVAGSLLAACAVATGAFAAHALRGQLDAAAMELWRTAVNYLFWHALALMLLALVPGPESHWRKAAGLAFLSGIGLFCGSLFALSLGAPRQTGMLTPLGGSAFLFGWICLAVLFARSRGDAR
ncbi:DUF423 domain-containing protein [Dokdonella sp.]|uniref:DUF423 domain-containing protein n=1 Tax=Dokdonella sp. TaxID=2291710 RepID=UPI00352976AE